MCRRGGGTISSNQRWIFLGLKAKSSGQKNRAHEPVLVRCSHALLDDSASGRQAQNSPKPLPLWDDNTKATCSKDSVGGGWERGGGGGKVREGGKGAGSKVGEGGRERTQLFNVMTNTGENREEEAAGERSVWGAFE